VRTRIRAQLHISPASENACSHWAPVILATQEAEIRRIMVQSQPRQMVLETLSRKNLHKNNVGGLAQEEGPEFKPQCHRKRRKRKRKSMFFIISHLIPQPTGKS
jgi:hypothetical protein